MPISRYVVLHNNYRENSLIQKHMPLLLRFELVWSRDSLCHSLSSSHELHSRPSTHKGNAWTAIPSHWLISNTAHTHTCITSPQAAAYLSRWPEGDTKNWIDNSRWKEVNPDCISLQVRQLGCKPELFFTPTSAAAAAVARAPSSLLIYTGSRLSSSGWQTLRGSEVGLVLDAQVLQCGRVESNKKVLSC